MQQHAARRLWTFIVTIMLTAQSGGLAAALPPFRLWGDLGYDYRFEHLENRGDLNEHIGSLKLNAATYIYQPWIAQLEGGVRLSLRDTDLDTGDSDGRLVTGEGLLRMFPLSSFPFEAFFERTDSSVDTDLTGLDLDLTRFGVQQRYTSGEGNNFRFRYERSEITQLAKNPDSDDLREDIADLLQLGFNRTFGKHSLILDANLNSVDRQNTADDTTTVFSLLSHRYRPGPRFNAEDRVTYNRQDITQNNLGITTDVIELNSFGFWRPQTEKPLLVNGTFRILDFNTSRLGQDSNRNSATATLGSSYQWSPRWFFTADGSVTRVEDDDEENINHFQRLRAEYNSDITRVLGFNADWFVGAAASNRSDDLGTVQSIDPEFGYELRRDKLFSGGSVLIFNAGQRFNFIEDTEGRSVQALFSNLGLSWTQSGGSISSFMRLSGSDSRIFGGGGRRGDEDREFQVFNFQASLDRKLNRSSSLLGNVTIQAVRSVNPSLSTAIDSVQGKFRPTATADLTYHNRKVFGVPQLRFRSTLRFFSDAYFPLLDTPREPNERENKEWENRLEYSIGRVDLRLIGRLSEINSLERAFVLFQVRRFFGEF